MTCYRRGEPAFEEPVHWEWLDELERAGVLTEVTADIPTVRHAIYEALIPMLDAGKGIECATLAKAAIAALGVAKT